MRPDTLLIDGDCGICRASGDWLAARVPPHELRVVELQSVTADAELAAAVAGRRLSDALHLVRSDGTVAAGAAAVIGAGRHLPLLGLAAAVYDCPIGHALWGPAYRLVARNRHRIGRAMGIEAVCATIPR